MTSRATLDRPRVPVAGAGELLASLGGSADGIIAARALADSSVGWAAARSAALAADRTVILAGRAGEPVLGLRWFAPGQATSVHDHGAAGATLLLEGTCRYERFERRDERTAVLESVHDLHAGDVAWWGTPPDDVHRQTAGPDGALELVLLAGPVREAVELDDATPPRSPLHDGVRRAFLGGDAAALEQWYAEDVLGDLNVPHWRFQVRGRTALLGLLHDEEFAKENRRLTHLRVTDTADGLAVETEGRFTESGEPRVFREAHLLRMRDGLVVEHTLWCAGISTAEQAEAQRTTAPMERM